MPVPARRRPRRRRPRGGLTRRDLLRSAGVGGLALGFGGCASEDFEPETSHREDAPNALLIVTDSTRADYIGAYNGDSLAKTPNIDALAKESLLFSLAVPESMPTGPVRRCLLSGMRGFPYRDWVITPGLPNEAGWRPIGDDQPIFTEVMGDAGVTTAYVTDNPFIAGPRFANFRRSLDYARPQYSQGAYRFFNKPFTRIASRSEVAPYVIPALSDTVEIGRLQQYVGWNNLYRHGERQYAAAKVCRTGMDLLDELKHQEPFFLGLDMFDPHEAFDPPASYMKNFPPTVKGNLERAGITPIQPFETPADPVPELRMDDDTIERVRELYAAELMFVDAWIGRVLNKLDDAGLADTTAVYYMSDHGVTLGEHGIVGKSRSRLYYHIYHVPCMIRHPERKLAGERHDFFASTHDVAATLLSFMGIRAPGAMTGEDLTVIFDGKDPPPRKYFTSSYADYLLAGDGRYILIAHSEGQERRLYDSQEDPGELTDVAGDNPEKVDELWQALIDDAGGTLPQLGENGVIGG
jgi:arylsulfatase A-like enzyme